MKDLRSLPPMDERFLVFGGLFLLSNRLETFGDSFLEELTSKQWFLMMTLVHFFEQPPTLGELASQMGCSRQNVKQLSLKLEDKGFLRLEKDSADGRVLRLIPTERFQSYSARRETEQYDFIDRFFGALGPERISQFNSTLQALYDHLLAIEQACNAPENPTKKGGAALRTPGNETADGPNP